MAFVFLGLLFGLLTEPPDGSTATQFARHIDGGLDHPRLVVQMGHVRSSRVTSVSFSPDGYRIVTASYDKTALVWDSNTGREIRRLKGHTGWVNSASFSADGERIVTASFDKTVRVWDADTGEELTRLEGHTDSVTSASFSADDKRIVTASSDKTVRLWHVGTGTEIKRLEGHVNYIKSVSFSADGKRIVTASYDMTARVWDADTGNELKRLEGHSLVVNSASFSPNGRWVVTSSDDKTARIWDVDTGKELKQLGGEYGINSASFSPDGKRVLTNSQDNTARIWDVANEKEVFALKARTDGATAPSWSGDGKQVVTATIDGVVVWDADVGRELKRLEGHTTVVHTASFSPDGRWIVTGSSDNTARVWDVATGKELTRLNGHKAGISSVAVSPDSGRIATASVDKTVRVWDVVTGKELTRLEGHNHWVTSVVFSNDGKRLMTASPDKTVRIWDADTGKEKNRIDGVDLVWAAFSPDSNHFFHHGSGSIWAFDTGKEIQRLERGVITVTDSDLRSTVFIDHYVESAVFSPDGRWIVTGSSDSTARVWDVTTGKEHMRLNGHTATVSLVAISPDSRRVVTGSFDDTVRVWDVASGKELKRLDRDTNSITSVSFSSDGKRLVTASRDGTTRIWDAESGKVMCSLIGFKDVTWAVVDPTGRYDASNGGDVDGLHWVVGNEPIALSQLKNRFYEPGLLAKVMGFNKEPLRDVAAFADVKLYPGIAVVTPKLGSTQATVTLTNRGGGIGPVRVLVNGKELLADARGPKPDPDAKEIMLAVDLAGAVNLLPGKPNEIEVIAYNAEGYLASRGFKKVYTPGGAAEEYKPELYAIVCGVSDYADPKLNLRYAAKDAGDFATALDLAGKRFFGADKVHITLLTTSDAPGAISPTKANIKKAFDAARNARPDDVLVIYFAGHGTTMGLGSDVYLYPTADARTLDPAAFTDPAVRAATAVTSDELTAWLTADVMRVRRQVMILDTCAAGAAAAKLTEKRDVSGDQVRALDRLKDRTGFHVLMGCAADAVSYEATEYGQGLLTYSLLEAMRGAGLRDGEFVDVAQLFGYATDRVPGLAGGVGGVQRPLVAAPRGSSFDVGQLNAGDKAKVPLALKRPLVLRSNFQDEDRLDDVIGLKKSVDRRLRDASLGGQAAKVVFVDAGEFPGAYRLAGRYAVSGDTVSVRLKVFRDDTEVATLKVEGDKGKTEVLAAKVVTEVERSLPQPK